jgi:geranylgeranyl diphosphate synthase type II
VLREVERMARESAEGQAIELGWISDQRFDLADRDYVRMAYKKTCWYTVIAPLRIGVICGSTAGLAAPLEEELLELVELGFLCGIAFQIHDDLLNLEADETLYGKEISGDLWEGKRTVMLLHFLRVARPRERTRAIRVLTAPRAEKDDAEVSWLLGAMQAAGSLAHGRELALVYSEKALAAYERCRIFATDSEHRDFIRDMLRYVIDRVK